MSEFTQSPAPTRRVPVEQQIDFYAALKEIAGGRRVTKLEWTNKEYYGILSEGRVKLHKPDGKLYDWIFSDGDLFGTDWVII